MRYWLIFFWIFVLLPGCTSENTNTEKAAGDEKAQKVIDEAIRVHGGKKYENLNLAFDFRGRHYTALKKDGMYTYTRSFQDSTGQVLDILTNKSFQRKINDQLVNLPEERKKAFSNSVNSVIYFALLPYGLNDPAVRKKYLGGITMRGQPYHKIKITFTRDGGGVDYEDEFIYYIHQKTHLLDYLAYSYKTEGGGLRFRQAYDPQVVGGIRFQQYINYQPPSKQVNLTGLDKLFEAGQLEELSRIELENIRVK